MWKRFCSGFVFILIPISAGLGAWAAWHHGYNYATKEHTAVLKSARLMYHKAYAALLETRASQVIGTPVDADESKDFEELTAVRAKAKLGVYAAVAEGDLPRARGWLERLRAAEEAFLDKHRPYWRDEVRNGSTN